MLTRDSYRRAVFQARCWLAAGFISLFASPALGIAASRSLRAPLVQVMAAVFPVVTSQQIGDAMLAGGIMVGFAACLLCLTICQSDARVRCPHCRQPRMNAALALATEHCETCGRPVPFERSLNVKSDPPPTPATADDPRLPSVDDFLRDFRRYIWYFLYVVVYPTLAILLVSIVLVMSVLVIRAEPPPAPRAPIVGVERWLAVASMVSPPLLYAVVALCRWRRPSLLTCPHCRSALIQKRNVVIASRHCPAAERGC
jgi:hypothetical protein